MHQTQQKYIKFDICFLFLGFFFVFLYVLSYSKGVVFFQCKLEILNCKIGYPKKIKNYNQKINTKKTYTNSYVESFSKDVLNMEILLNSFYMA